MGNDFYSKQQPEKKVKIRTYKSLSDVIANIPEINQNTEKNSPEFISLVARYCNYAGRSSKITIEFICENYELEESIVYPIVIETYDKYAAEFGSKSLMYHLKLRNKFDDEDLQNMPYIPQKVYDQLPKIYQRATEKFKLRKRDILLTGLLGVTSGMVKTYGILNGETTYPNLFCFVVAPPASGKGVLKYAKAIGQIRQIALHESEARINIFIPANISTAVIYKRLHDNGGIGILFESEADTMKNTMKNEWGTYDDLLRNAFHFEEASLERKDRTIKIEHPRLSVILSGTPNQIRGIIPDAENGLFSRFIFYTFKSASHWDKEADLAGFSLDDYFLELSEEFSKIILKSELAKQFSFTEKQREIFHSRFDKWLKEFKLYHEESEGIIFRLGNITFRIAMILTAIRFGEQENPTETPTLYCNDVDFETAFLLAETYKNHSLFVYVTLKNKPGNNKPIDKMVQMFYEKLPNEFTKFIALELGRTEEIGIADRTVTKYLSNLITAGHLEQPKHGFYRKMKIEKTQESEPDENEPDENEQ